MHTHSVLEKISKLFLKTFKFIEETIYVFAMMLISSSILLLFVPVFVIVFGGIYAVVMILLSIFGA